MAHSTLVPAVTTDGRVPRSTPGPGNYNDTDAWGGNTEGIPPSEQNVSTSGEALSEMFRAMGMNRATAEILTASWAENTRKQYTLVLRRWAQHCGDTGINAKSPTLNEGIAYLEKLFTEGAARTTINTVRSLLSAFVTIGGKPFGEHPLVGRLLKGIGNLKPGIPKYESIWDPAQLLTHLRGWGPTQRLDTEKLNKRTACLFLLATGQRLQALGQMKRRDIRWEENSCTLRYSTKLKSNDPVKNPLILTFNEYEVGELCVFGHLREYMGRSELEGADPAVFATMRTPHVAASQETLSRYVRTTMAEAGIDMQQFTPYSCRHATTSAALRKQVPIATILTAAGWASEGTFRRFYNRPIRAIQPTNLIPNIMGPENT